MKVSNVWRYSQFDPLIDKFSYSAMVRGCRAATSEHQNSSTAPRHSASVTPPYTLAKKFKQAHLLSSANCTAMTSMKNSEKGSVQYGYTPSGGIKPLFHHKTCVDGCQPRLRSQLEPASAPRVEGRC